MKHFAEARRDAAAAAGGLANCDGVCLIWDLRGQLRLLIHASAGADTSVIEAQATSVMTSAAERFWSRTIWIRKKGSKLLEAEKVVYDEAWKRAKILNTAPLEVRELDRHLSKESWFGVPLTPPWPAISHAAPILSFYSYKGGVGRSTALAAFAIQMARAGKRVCVLDLDLEAPGVGTLLTASTGQARYGVLDYLLEAELGGTPVEIGEYFHLCDDQRVVGAGPPIVVVPAGELDDDYLEKLARVDYRGILSPTTDHASGLPNLLKALRAERNPDYFLIDSRSGLHDIGGLALNGLAHLDVIFGIASEQSWQGLQIVVPHLGRHRIERELPHQTFTLVYAMAPANSHADRISRVNAFRDRAHQLLSNDFYNEEPESGWPSPLPEDIWPVPAIDDATEPHYAVPIGFNPDIQQASSLDTIATTLTEGDYSAFGLNILERLGKTMP